eukprot:6208188-Pleurochrysis_carterae.AAC.3
MPDRTVTTTSFSNAFRSTAHAPPPNRRCALATKRQQSPRSQRSIARHECIGEPLVVPPAATDSAHASLRGAEQRRGAPAPGARRAATSRRRPSRKGRRSHR